MARIRTASTLASPSAIGRAQRARARAGTRGGGSIKLSLLPPPKELTPLSLSPKTNPKTTTKPKQLGAATASASSSSRRAAVVCRAETAAPTGERLRLHNLSPQDGARRANKRKGRGYGGHQGGTCGFGTRGQKSRAGSGTRPGFEGGQTALYRRLPKLRGICGGMPAGTADHVVVNLDDLESHFAAGEEVTLDALVAKGVLHVSGSDEKLPLKVLGAGEVTKALNVKAAKFSASAAEKIAAAGGTADVQATKAKWTRRAYEKAVAEAKAAGKDLVAETLKKKKAAKVAKAAAASAGKA